MVMVAEAKAIVEVNDDGIQSSKGKMVYPH